MQCLILQPIPVSNVFKRIDYRPNSLDTIGLFSTVVIKIAIQDVLRRSKSLGVLHENPFCECLTLLSCVSGETKPQVGKMRSNSFRYRFPMPVSKHRDITQ